MTTLYKFLQKTALAAWVLFFFMAALLCVAVIAFFVYRKKSARKDDTKNQWLRVLEIFCSLSINAQGANADELLTLQAQLRDLAEKTKAHEEKDAELQNNVIVLKAENEKLTQALAENEKAKEKLTQALAENKKAKEKLTQQVSSLKKAKETAQPAVVSSQSQPAPVETKAEKPAKTNADEDTDVTSVVMAVRQSEAQLRYDLGKIADQLRVSQDADSVAFLQESIQNALQEISIALKNSKNRKV